MTYNIIAVALGVMLMTLGDLVLPNQVKAEYENNGGSWGKVLTYSRASSALLGLLSVLVIKLTDMPSELNPELVAFATSITAYIAAQTIMTDMRILKINRHILRLAYITLFALAIYNTSTNQYFIPFKSGVYIFAIALLGIFLFVNIGASDVRAIAVALPFSAGIGGAEISVGLLVIGLIIAAIFIQIKRKPIFDKKMIEFKEKYSDILDDLGEKEFNKIAKKVIKEELNTSKEYAIPVGPFMIVPFVLFFIVYPIIILL